jgi:hypothetical protein
MHLLNSAITATFIWHDYQEKAWSHCELFKKGHLR